MSDPMMQKSDDVPPLWKTVQHAQLASARAATGWRKRIMDRLAVRPSAIWELAEHFGVSDNRISGRISDLARDLKIGLAGERRVNPATRCPGEVWRVIERAAGSGQQAAGRCLTATRSGARIRR